MDDAGKSTEQRKNRRKTKIKATAILGSLQRFDYDTEKIKRMRKCRVNRSSRLDKIATEWEKYIPKMKYRIKDQNVDSQTHNKMLLCSAHDESCWRVVRMLFLTFTLFLSLPSPLSLFSFCVSFDFKQISGSCNLIFRMWASA